MRLDTFFEKFELFADAPNAVAKMRELVLRLAFSGGLSGGAAKQDGLPVGWKQKTIESICSSITPGFACSRSHQVENGHVHLRTHNISIFGTLNFDLLVRIDPKMVDAQKASIRKGDILFNNTNSQELVGKTCLVDQDYDYGFSNHITRLRLKEDVFPGFVVFYLTFLRNSGYFAQLCTRWINQAAVNTETLKKETIPLPSLAEQKRIVAKVDELMALCDRLETQQQERDTRHTALARAFLARFAEAPTPANLDFLFHPSYAITPTDLRKTVLTLAVQGKLVPQDPNDEPADTLLSQIADEKRRLVAARIIRQQDVATLITEDELPFEAPVGWEWARLSSITRRIHYGYTASAKTELRDVRLLRITDIQNNFVDWPSVPGCEIAREDVSQYQLERGDILVARTGGTVGKTYLVQDVPVVAVFASYLIRIQGGASLFDRYLKLFLESPIYWAQLEEGTRGAAQPNVNGQTLGRMVVSVPPLAEQCRIVAKVDQLMALVDQLETQLTEAKTKSAALLDAAIHVLLNPAAEIVDLASYRAAIGCYVIRKMEGKRYFGRTAAMKVLYLAEAHVGLELGFKPLREAAGPFDPWIYRFEEEGEREGWFKPVSLATSDGKTKIEYRAGRALSELSQAEQILTLDQRKEFDRLLALLSDKTTEEAEIIATLFAAWNDFLIDGHAPGDDEIVTEVRENWHERKGRFTPTRLQQWLGWLRQSNLVPQGRLPHTVHQPQLSLN